MVCDFLKTTLKNHLKKQESNILLDLFIISNLYNQNFNIKNLFLVKLKTSHNISLLQFIQILKFN